MSEKWPWYTEWGGIFMPFEDALGNSCIMAIVMIILWGCGFVIYLVIKLIVEVIKAIGRPTAVTTSNPSVTPSPLPTTTVGPRSKYLPLAIVGVIVGIALLSFFFFVPLLVMFINSYH